MGAGKTTVGKAFAKQCGLSFIDLDWYIEERFHKTVGELFTERGEEGFREIERNMLHEVADIENVVISTGGGTPCFFDNMSFMNQKGITVYLNVSQDILLRRLRVATQTRPILQGKNDLELLELINEGLNKRVHYYKQAKYSFDGNNLENRRQIGEFVKQLGELLKIDGE